MVLKRLGIGKGKKSGYFLEAPEAAKEALSDAKEALSDAKAALEKPAEALKAAAEKPAEALKAVKEALTPAAEATANGAAEAASKAVSTQKKFKKTKSASDDVPQAVAPQAAPVAPAPKAAPAPEVPATANFATEHLIPKNTPRRRPGPSLDMFKDMAKQVSPRR
jgi:hypothetical protein